MPGEDLQAGGALVHPLVAGSWLQGAGYGFTPSLLPCWEPWGVPPPAHPMGLSISGCSTMGVCCRSSPCGWSCYWAVCWHSLAPGCFLLANDVPCPLSRHAPPSCLLPASRVCGIIIPCRSSHASLHLHLDGLNSNQALKSGSVRLVRLYSHKTKPEFQYHIPSVHRAVWWHKPSPWGERNFPVPEFPAPDPARFLHCMGKPRKNISDEDICRFCDLILNTLLKEKSEI